MLGGRDSTVGVVLLDDELVLVVLVLMLVLVRGGTVATGDAGPSLQLLHVV
jgi:hypothetical protein